MSPLSAHGLNTRRAHRTLRPQVLGRSRLLALVNCIQRGRACAPSWRAISHPSFARASAQKPTGWRRSSLVLKRRKRPRAAPPEATYRALGPDLPTTSSFVPAGPTRAVNPAARHRPLPRAYGACSWSRSLKAWRLTAVPNALRRLAHHAITARHPGSALRLAYEERTRIQRAATRGVPTRSEVTLSVAAALATAG
jgi:hypothetical protein